MSCTRRRVRPALARPLPGAPSSRLERTLRPRSHTGGRHELGQNFLTHRPTLRRLTTLTAATDGAILEIGAGDGALTHHLARLGRDLRAIDIDAQRVDHLRTRIRGASIQLADAMLEPLDRPVIVGNLPFHLTTPLLRRLLSTHEWQHAILLSDDEWRQVTERAKPSRSATKVMRAIRLGRESPLEPSESRL